MDTLNALPRVHGDRLRRLRREQFLSHRDLSRISGLSTTTILKLEQERGGARPSTVRRLAEALGVEPGYLAEIGEE